MEIISKILKRKIVFLLLSALFIYLIMSSEKTFPREPAKRKVIISRPLTLALDDIQDYSHETLLFHENIFFNLKYCQSYSSNFPCLEILKRINQIDSKIAESDSDLGMLRVDKSHLRAEFVNNEFGLTFSLTYPNFRLEKYFKEVKGHAHRDIRYFNNSIVVDPRTTLTDIYKAWMYFSSDKNITEWWIAHGNLLAWSWEGKVFPWGI